VENQTRAQWGSRLALILATAGSAIGLGNVWKFPYITGENGGGAFVLIYLACILVIGIPILVAELYIGQKSQCNTVEAFEVLHKKGTIWRLPGWMGLLSAFIILSFYSVVGGWILDFEFRSLLAQFSNSDEQAIKGILGSLFLDPLRQGFWHLVFMSLTVGIVISGVSKGLERWNKILMPSLLLILCILFVRVMFLEGFGESLAFLFSPNFDKLTPDGVLEAVGHSFFTLSLGMGAIITYGSYMKKDEKLLNVAVTVAVLDTLIALIAGVIIFSIVFTYGLEPGGGPGLIFSTLPMLFAKMTGGYFLSVIFFLLMTFAALTSAVSILEVVVAYFSEKKKMSRKKSSLICGLVIYMVGILTVLSTNIMSDVKIFGLTFFDFFDKLSANYLLPLGGLFISLFFGWVLGPKTFESLPKWSQGPMLWSTRVIAPVGVITVFYHKVFGL